MSVELKRTASFVATFNDGQEIRIIEWTEITTIKSRSETQHREGLKKLKTEDGRSVNRISKGVYDIVDVMGLIRVTSDDPNAP